jgi:YVTN family beta-propeller protein
MKLSPGLLATVAALCIAAGAVRAQYVEDSIDIGGRLVGSLVYNSREDVLYGTAYYGGFFAISCDSNKVVRSLALSYPVAVAYDSVDNKAWCVYWPSDMESLAVIDGTTHSIMKKIGMPGALQPVWDPVSNRVYVSCDMTNSVAVVDCVTDSVLAYIPVGAEPESMYINTLRRKLYVMNFDDGTVSVINMLTNQVTATVSIGGYAGIGYYSRSVDKFYCAGPEGQCVVIDGQSDSESRGSL